MIIRFICEYFGAGFNGFQKQGKKCGKTRTVQAVLEDAISKYLKSPIKIAGSGRTDSGVHARGQVCSFEFCDDACDLNTNKCMHKMCAAANAFLPADVSVRDFCIAGDNFHAQFCAKAKTYIYKCYVSPYRSALRSATHLQLFTAPNIRKMKEAAKLIEGEHDFTSFCSEKTDKKNFVRTIYSFDIIEFEDDEIIFKVTGSGFLHNMLRIMIGTILDVGYCKISVERFSEILQARNRKLAGKTAPAHGLVLDCVEYRDN